MDRALALKNHYKNNKTPINYQINYVVLNDGTVLKFAVLLFEDGEILIETNLNSPQGTYKEPQILGSFNGLGYITSIDCQTRKSTTGLINSRIYNPTYYFIGLSHFVNPYNLKVNLSQDLLLFLELVNVPQFAPANDLKNKSHRIAICFQSVLFVRSCLTLYYPHFQQRAARVATIHLRCTSIHSGPHLLLPTQSNAGKRPSSMHP